MSAVQPTEFTKKTSLGLERVGNQVEIDNTDTNPVPVGPIENYFDEIALGNIEGKLCVNKFGVNRAVGTGGEVISDLGGATLPYPTTASTISIVSASAQDGPAGTGVASIRMFGLDANWNLQQEDIALDGQTPVVSVGTYRRVFRAYGLTLGSGATAPTNNDGNITFTHGAIDVARISADEGQTLMAVYTIPAGKYGLLQQVYGGALKSAGANVNADIHLHIVGPDGVERNWFEFSAQDTGSTFVSYRFAPPKLIDEKFDMYIKSFPSVSAEMQGGFDIVLVDK